MARARDSWVFAFTLAAAAAVLVSIAAAETLLAMACVAWIVQRPRPIVWPSYVIPLAAFMVLTVVALLMSPQPEIGSGAVRKFVLFTMAFLAANLVTTPSRARVSVGVLIVVAAAASGYALVQFVMKYAHFASTQRLADDPTVLGRITGFMGHWMTFSGEQLLVWCAAVPAMLILSRRWTIPLGLIGAGLVLSFTRSAWLGALAAFVLVALLIPRKILVAVAVPVALVAVAASGLIYHRLAFSFQEQGFAPDSGRYELFIGGVRMIEDHPLFGVGPERIHIEFPRYARSLPTYYGHLENNIVQIAAERGLLCLTAFLWFIFEIYASLIAMLKTSTNDSRWIVLSALSALTGFIIAGIVFIQLWRFRSVATAAVHCVDAVWSLQDCPRRRIMPNQFSPDNQLTPEAVAVLQDVEPDLKALRIVDLGDTPLAPVFEPGDRITRE